LIDIVVQNIFSFLISNLPCVHAVHFFDCYCDGYMPVSLILSTAQTYTVICATCTADVTQIDKHTAKHK